MAKNAASETSLGELHAKVAKVITGALTVTDVAQEVYLAAAEAADGDTELLLSLPTMPVVNPALLSVATKFLADNKITCAPDESAELSELDRRLAEVRARAANRQTVGNVVHLDRSEASTG